MKINDEWICDNCGAKLNDTWLYEKMFGQYICKYCGTINDALGDSELQYDGIDMREKIYDK